MDDLHAAFLPRFLEAARGRLSKAFVGVQDAGRDATTATLRDLHALAGEAGLLGLTSVLELTRVSEDRARALLADRSDAAITALRNALDEIGRALDELDPKVRG